MKSAIATAVAALLAAGCFTRPPRTPTLWIVTYPAGESAALQQRNGQEGNGKPVIRVARVDVCAPYDGQRLAVLRPDGSVAFDPLNSFAAPPAALLRAAALDAAAASPLAAVAIDRLSGASTPYSIEVAVSRLALDCKAKGSRKASVALAVSLLDGRNVVARATAESTADAASGDYTAAFSQAFAQAMDMALGDIRIPER